jgi:hypothetical protein
MTGLVSSASNALRTRIVKYVSEKKPVDTGLSSMTILGMILTKIKMTDGNCIAAYSRPYDVTYIDI